MALAVLAAGGLRAALPAQLRNGDARWAFVAVLVVLLAILIIGDPGRIDRDSVWLRVMTGTLIGLISVVNVAAKQARDDTRLAWRRQACGGSAQDWPGGAGAHDDDG